MSVASLIKTVTGSVLFLLIWIALWEIGTITFSALTLQKLDTTFRSDIEKCCVKDTMVTTYVPCDMTGGVCDGGAKLGFYGAVANETCIENLVSFQSFVTSLTLYFNCSVDKTVIMDLTTDGTPNARIAFIVGLVFTSVAGMIPFVMLIPRMSRFLKHNKPVFRATLVMLTIGMISLGIGFFFCWKAYKQAEDKSFDCDAMKENNRRELFSYSLIAVLIVSVSYIALFFSFASLKDAIEKIRRRNEGGLILTQTSYVAGEDTEDEDE